MLVLHQDLLSRTDPGFIGSGLCRVVLLVRESAPEMVAPEFPEPGIPAIAPRLPVLAASGVAVGQGGRRPQAHEVLVET